MSINQSFAQDPNKTDRLGRLFSTIDFVLNEDINSAVIKQKRYNEVIAGDLVIDNFKFKMTLSELERIAETAISAKETFIKKYHLGFYGK